MLSELLFSSCFLFMLSVHLLYLNKLNNDDNNDKDFCRCFRPYLVLRAIKCEREHSQASYVNVNTVRSSSHFFIL